MRTARAAEGLRLAVSAWSRELLRAGIAPESIRAQAIGCWLPEIGALADRLRLAGLGAPAAWSEARAVVLAAVGEVLDPEP